MTDHQHTPQFNPDTFKWGCSDCGAFIDAADVPQGGFSGPAVEAAVAEDEAPGRKLGLFPGNATDTSGPKPTVPQAAWDLAAWRAVENRRKAASLLALAEKDEAFIAKFDPRPTDQEV